MARLLYPALTCIPLLVACGSTTDDAIPADASGGAASTMTPETGSGGENGSGSGGVDGGPTGSGGSDGTGGTVGSGGSMGVKACADDPYPMPGAEAEQFFEKLTARLTDGGDAAFLRSVQVCSFDVCLAEFTATGDGGVEFLNSPVEGQDPSKLLGPAFKVGDGIGHATIAYMLPSEPEHELGNVEVISLPSPEGGEALVPGGESSSAGVTVSLASDAAIKFDRLFFPNEEDQVFRAAVRTDVAHPTFEEEDTVIVAMSPEGTAICPAADLSVPNERDWPAGSDVLIRFHGTKLPQEYAPYGGFGEDVAGKVSEDGTSIVFEDAVQSLGVMEIRLAGG